MEVPASGRSIILKERLQKIISHAGICSRRKAEELIKGGKVTVNGVRVTELGSEADVRKDKIVDRNAFVIFCSINRTVSLPAYRIHREDVQ